MRCALRRRFDHGLALGFTGLLLSVGCLSSVRSQTNGDSFQYAEASRDWAVADEKARTHSSIATSLRLVIYDVSALSQFPLLDMDVDFSSQMVLLAAMGPSSSEQCSIRIQRVWQDENRLRVEVQERYPASDRRRRPKISSPFHAVVVPRSELPIVGFTSRILPATYYR